MYALTTAAVRWRMAVRSLLLLTLVVTSLTAAAACDSTVVGGGGGGLGGGGGASGGDASSTTTEVATTGASKSVTTSSSTGGAPADAAGVIVPRDEEDVTFLVGNSPQSCEAPQTEPPCLPGSQWLANVTIPQADLAPGSYPINTGEIGLNVAESFDFCNGGGGRGWSGDEDAWLTVETIDASYAVITIEGAYDDVDGTYDVPLCGGVTPA